MKKIEITFNHNEKSFNHSLLVNGIKLFDETENAEKEINEHKLEVEAIFKKMGTGKVNILDVIQEIIALNVSETTIAQLAVIAGSDVFEKALLQRSGFVEMIMDGAKETTRLSEICENTQKGTLPSVQRDFPDEEEAQLINNMITLISFGAMVSFNKNPRQYMMEHMLGTIGKIKSRFEL